MQGTAPTVIICMNWILIIIAILLLVKYLEIDLAEYYFVINYNNFNVINSKLENLKLFGIIIFNIVIVLIANIGFVYVVLTQSTYYLYIFSLILVGFKLIWNNSIIIPILDHFNCRPHTILAVVVFNNVLCPIIATMGTDVSCFLNLIINPNELTSTYSFLYCDLISGGICLQYASLNYSISYYVSTKKLIF
jgi:hypothetical protein